MCNAINEVVFNNLKLVFIQLRFSEKFDNKLKAVGLGSEIILNHGHSQPDSRH